MDHGTFSQGVKYSGIRYVSFQLSILCSLLITFLEDDSRELANPHCRWMITALSVSVSSLSPFSLTSHAGRQYLGAGKNSAAEVGDIRFVMCWADGGRKRWIPIKQMDVAWVALTVLYLSRCFGAEFFLRPEGMKNRYVKKDESGEAAGDLILRWVLGCYFFLS